MLSDGELLQRYSTHGAQDAFAELVRRHAGVVYHAACRQLGADHHLAEDVTQSVFTLLARRAGSLTHHPVMVGWLHVATRNQVANTLRIEQRRRRREEENFRLEEAAAAMSHPTDWSAISPVIDHALHRLNPAERDAVLLRYFEGQSYDEIGRSLGVSADAARMRAERGLQKMRTVMERGGIVSTGAALAATLTAHAAATVSSEFAASLAASATATASIAGAGTTFFTLMSSTKTAVVLATLAVAGMFVAVQQYQSAQSAREALAAALADRNRLQRELAEASTAVRTPREQPAAPASPSESTRSNPKVLTRNEPAVAKDLLDGYLASSETRRAYVNLKRSQAQLAYAPFFKAASLNPEKQEQFLRVIEEQAQAALDIRETARSQGLLGPFDTPAAARNAAIGLEQLQKNSAIGIDGDMKQALGDSYDQFNAFRVSLPEQTTLGQIASALATSGAPLDAGQSQRLVDILTQNRFQRGQSAPAPANSMGGVQLPDVQFAGSKVQANAQNQPWAAPITDAAIASAATLLSEAQLATLRQIQGLQLAQMQAAPPHR